jgi:putative transposase
VADNTKHRHLPHLLSFQDCPITFFTVTTKNRATILAQPAVHDVLKDIWTGTGERSGWYIGRYVIMPDHVHFFARPAINASKMYDWIKMWKSLSSRRLGAVLHDGGGLWQRDYFDRYLRTSESYSEKWLYVCQNPVRAGLVNHADEWPFAGEISRLES